MTRCLISNDFETSRHNATLEYLGKYFDNTSLGMDTARYLEMCEAMGDEPDLDKIPPEIDSFPDYVQLAIEIFNSLPDTYSGGMAPVYTGKNLSSLLPLYEIFQVVGRDKMKVFEVIRFLDSRARKQAINEAKKANKKA